MIVPNFPRKRCRSRRKIGVVCTQGILEPQPQTEGAWKEEETSKTVTLSRSPWEPNCIIWMETHVLFLFLPHLLWYQNKTQSEEDGILKQYIPVITGKK